MNSFPKWSEGTFAKKQFDLRLNLISWSHRRRFQLAKKIANAYADKTILDFGCGDGTFLCQLCDSDAGFSRLTGIDVSKNLIEDCRARLSSYKQISFALVSDILELPTPPFFDVVFCMEVLEHVTDIQKVVEQLEQLLRPHGTVVISVPAEIGPALLIKQTLRRVAKLMGFKDYPGSASYTYLELVKSVFAGEAQHIKRPIYSDGVGGFFHDHKGFNWKALKCQLSKKFTLEPILTSPVPWVPTSFSSQIWLIGHPIDKSI